MSSRALLLAILALLFATATPTGAHARVNHFAAAHNVTDAGLDEPAELTASELAPVRGSLLDLIRERTYQSVNDAQSQATPSPSPSSSSSRASLHSHAMHTMQLPFNQFTMELMTNRAPWSPRIQPALLYMRREVRYTQWATNITVSQGTPWLILYEGSFTWTTANGTVLGNENDVWASGDYGRTWDLMAGVSRFGLSNRRVESMYPNTFEARGGANNCEDPASDYIFSIGGYRNEQGGGSNRQGTNAVWYSSDGITWAQQNAAYRFGPSRYFSSCDVDESGHIYSMGGIVIDPNWPTGAMLNDVWQSSIVSGLREWRRVTAEAPWSARAEHLVLVGNAPALQKELIYVIGGQSQVSSTGVTNDVWVSSDGAQTWVPLVENGAEFGARWGHGGVITAGGVLVLFGGSYQGTRGTETFRDMWASFDGGVSWGPCVIDSKDVPYIRTEMGASLTDDGELLLASGYLYDPNLPGGRAVYNDVWKTSFSLDDTELLAELCGAQISDDGVGLTEWPLPVVQNSFGMTVQTRRAPWSARIQPAILSMSTPISYVQTGTKLKISTPPNWLLMYEGSLTYGSDTDNQNENDVWASADNGASWDMISGITRHGTNGLGYSTLPYSSFSDRGGSSNCEDPLNDDVYSLGGYARVPNGGDANSMNNEVWYSSDAMHWSLQAGPDVYPPVPRSFVARYFSQCAVDYNHQIILAGGATESPFITVLFNDVWIGTNLGRSWRLATGRAPWSQRSEHVLLLQQSQALGRTLLFVMGGFTSMQEGSYTSTNDVWVSSDSGVSWAQVTARAPWISRWGHAAAVTRDGALVVVGGSDSRSGWYRDMQTWKDGWVSLDGGYNWFQLRITGDVSYIRGEQGATLTADERLVLVSGYAYNKAEPRTDYADLWISNISMSNVNAMTRVSLGGAVVPSGGIGLRQWPGTSPVSEILSPLMIGLIAGGGALLLAIIVGCVLYRRRNARLPSVAMPAFLSPRAARRAPAPVSNGDYFTSQTGRDSDKYSFSDASSLSDHYQPPTGGYQPPAAHGGYQPPSHLGHNGDSHGLLS